MTICRSTHFSHNNAELVLLESFMVKCMPTPYTFTENQSILVGTGIYIFFPRSKSGPGALQPGDAHKQYTSVYDCDI